MATRPSILKQGSKGGKLSPPALRQLAKDVRAELGRLRTQDKKGDITGKQMATGLKAAEESLDELEIHIGYLKE